MREMRNLPNSDPRTFCICLISLPLLILPSSLASDGAKSSAFPLPERIAPLFEAVTPREYADVVTAIENELRKPAVSAELEQGAGLGPLNNIQVTRVRLGSLEAEVVEFSHSGGCGNGGCPMWLFLRDPRGYRSAIRSGGWAFSTVSSGGPVPDVVFFGQSGAGETDVSQFHYVNGDFIGVPAKPEKCGGEDDLRGVCAARTSDADNWVTSVTLDEYNALWRAIQADPKKPSDAPSRHSFYDNAHAITIPVVNDIVATAVGVGACTVESNCTISIYGCKQTYAKASSPDYDVTTSNIPKCDYWPLLRDVSGWGVANASDLATDPFSPKTAFVIARRLSATDVQLTRYSVTTETGGPQPGSKLLPDACEIVTPKSGKWPARWDPTALSARPSPCE